MSTPRNGLFDYLQVFPFWLMDVAPISPLSLPVLTPLFGFSSMTAPDFSLDVEEIPDGTAVFRRKVIKSASVGTLTIGQGSTAWNSDFWRWTQAAATGDTGGLALSGVLSLFKVGGPTYRRTLVLIHFSNASLSTSGLVSGNAAAVAASVVANIGVGSLGAGLAGASLTDVATFAATSAVTQSIGALIGAVSGGPKDIMAARIPAKAWVLEGAIPKRYKAGTDFDAGSSNVSIMELEIEVEAMDELSLFG